jgi:uncharacterized protein (TIGR03067 family)
MKSLALTLSGFLITVLAPAAPSGGADENAAVLRKLEGTWDLERPGHKPSDVAQNGDVWWTFESGLLVITCHDGQTEQFRCTPVVNARANPMWLDLRYPRGETVVLGICKLEGDRLIYVPGKHVKAEDYARAKGELPGRPSSFTPAKGDEDREQVLLRNKKSGGSR